MFKVAYAFQEICFQQSANTYVMMEVVLNKEKLHKCLGAEVSCVRNIKNSSSVLTGSDFGKACYVFHPFMLDFNYKTIMELRSI